MSVKSCRRWNFHFCGWTAHITSAVRTHFHWFKQRSVMDSGAVIGSLHRDGLLPEAGQQLRHAFSKHQLNKKIHSRNLLALHTWRHRKSSRSRRDTVSASQVSKMSSRGPVQHGRKPQPGIQLLCLVFLTDIHPITFAYCHLSAVLPRRTRDSGHTGFNSWHISGFSLPKTAE